MYILLYCRHGVVVVVVGGGGGGLELVTRHCSAMLQGSIPVVNVTVLDDKCNRQFTAYMVYAIIN